MTAVERLELWRKRIAAYRSSGERVVTWCERHAVTEKQLYYWMRKLKKQDGQKPSNNPSQWVSLLTEDTTEHRSSPLLVRINSASIEIRSGFDPSLLADVVKALKAIC